MCIRDSSRGVCEVRPALLGDAIGDMAALSVAIDGVLQAKNNAI